MDPEATLDCIRRCVEDGDGQGAREACASLLGWFSSGGFAVGTNRQRQAIRDYFIEASVDNLAALKRAFGTRGAI